MNQTSEELAVELNHPRFRWFRRAWLVGAPVVVLFVVGVALFLLRGDGGLFPVVKIAFGIYCALFGALVVCRSRTYLEYLNLETARGFAERGTRVPDRERWLAAWRDNVLAALGGPGGLVVGVWLLLSGVTQLF